MLNPASLLSLARSDSYPKLPHSSGMAKKYGSLYLQLDACRKSLAEPDIGHDD